MNRTHLGSVTVPFDCSVDPGNSTFDILVPKIYSRKKFYLRHCMMIPDFFKKMAKFYGFDTQAELEEVKEHEIFLIAKYSSPLSGFYTPPVASMTVSDLTKQINHWFEDNNKIDGFLRSPCFFDWTDLRFEESDVGTFDEWVKFMALAYYGVPFNKRLHYGVLPKSVENVDDSHNYLIPTELNDLNYPYLRIRIFVGANVYVGFNRNEFIREFGFTDSQLTLNRNKYCFVNPMPNEWIVENANHGFADIVVPVRDPGVKMSARMYHQNFVSTSKIAKTVWKSSNSLIDTFNAINAPLRELSFETNLDFVFQLDASTKSFNFTFRGLLTKMKVSVMVPYELAQMLGFGIVNEINSYNPSGLPVSDAEKIEDFEMKARTLCYDTGMIVISDASRFTTFNYGAFDMVMASLYPSDQGRMEMKLQQSEHSHPTLTQMPDILTGSANSHELVKMTFKLSRFLENNKLIPFLWLIGARIYGELVGIDC